MIGGAGAFVGPFETSGQLVFTAFAAVFVGVGLLFLWKAVRALRRGVAVAVSDPVDAGSVHLTDGLVELEGTAEPIGGTVEGVYSGEETLAYTYEKKRRRRRTDSDGNTETTWTTVDSGREATPFRVVDDTGAVAVDPEGAALSFEESSEGGGGDTRKLEGRLDPGETVHVYGQKRSAAGTGEAPGEQSYFVGDGGAVDDFMISDTTEFRTVLRYLLKGVGLLFVAVVWLVLSSPLAVGVLETVFGVDPGPWAAAVTGFVEGLLGLG